MVALLLVSAIPLLSGNTSAATEWMGYLPTVNTDADRPLVSSDSDATGHAEIALSAVLDEIKVPTPTTPYYELRVQTTASANVLGTLSYSDPVYNSFWTDVYFEPVWDDPAGGILDLSGDQFVKIPLPYSWAFPYFGRYYVDIWVSENGFAVLGEESLASGYPAYSILWPNPEPPNGVLAPYWKDIDMSQSGRLVYGYGRSIDGVHFDWFDILWQNAMTYPDSNIQNFKITLHKDGVIDFWYDNVVLEFTPQHGKLVPDFAMALEDQLGARAISLDYNQVSGMKVITVVPSVDNQWAIRDIRVDADKFYHETGSNDYEATVSVTGTYNGQWAGINLDWGSGANTVRPYDDADHRYAAQVVDQQIQHDPVGKAFTGWSYVTDISNIAKSYWPTLNNDKRDTGRTTLVSAYAKNVARNYMAWNGYAPDVWSAPVFIWRLYDDTTYTPGGLGAHTHDLGLYAQITCQDYDGVIHYLTTGVAVQFELKKPTVPDAPTGLTATPSNGKVALSWSAPSWDGGNPIVRYNIYRGTTSGQLDWVFICYTTSYDDTGVTNGVRYYYKVSAVNGVGEGAKSNEANAMPVNPVDQPPVTEADVVGGWQHNQDWYSSKVAIYLYASDDSGVVAATYYKFDSAHKWNEYTDTVWYSREGRHTMYFYSVDGAGNRESEKSVAVNIDTTPPTTTCKLTGTKSGKVYVSDVKVTLTAEDSLSGVYATWYRINRGSWIEYTVPFWITVNGKYTIEYQSFDILINEEPVRTTSFTIQKP